MADVSASSKLDNMGKEELIKLIKKYIILQKQMKAKNEDLSVRLQKAENTFTNTTAEAPSNSESKIKGLEDKIGELTKTNVELNNENIQFKEQIENLTKSIESLKKSVAEYENYRADIEPQVDKARQEIELNKSMLGMLNNEVQMLTADKIVLEKRLFSTRRNVTPSIIVEEDEDDLEEEKRNEGNNQYNPSQDDTFGSYGEDNLDAIDRHNEDLFMLSKGPSTNDGILILNKQIEDLTFYCDELKSELEVERERNNEYVNEIKDYKTQIEDFEQQHEFNSLEMGSINEGLHKENEEAKATIARLEEKLASLAVSGSTAEVLDRGVRESGASSVRLAEFLVLFSDEILAKKNFEFFSQRDLYKEDRDSVSKFISQLKESFKSYDDRLSKELVKSFEVQKNFEGQMEKVSGDFKRQIAEIEGRVADKQAEINELKEKAEADLKAMRAELEKERSHAKDTHKEISKNKLLDMELADYERSIKLLNSQLKAKDKEMAESVAKLEEIKANLGKAKAENEKMVKELDGSHERSGKLKDMLAKAKSELSEAREQETQHVHSDAQMKYQIEQFNIQIESYKMNLSNAAADCQKLQEKLNKEIESHDREVTSLANKLEMTEEAREELNKKLTNLKSEYDNYKVKVQHAFKKQKADSLSPSKEDTSKSEYDLRMLTEQNESLKRNVREDREKLEQLERENENLQDQFAKSLERNTKLLNELKEKENDWKLKIEELKKQHSTKTDQTSELIRNLEVEKEAQLQNFKEKLKQLNSAHTQSVAELQNKVIDSKQEVEMLYRQVNELKEKNTSLEMNVKNKSPSTSSPLNSTGVAVFRQNSVTPQKSVDQSNNFILRQVENIDIHLEAGNKKPNKSLDELLNETPNSPTTAVSPNISSNNNNHDSKHLLQQMEALKLEMSKGRLQLVHLNELLNESELNNSRLTDQINVLKDEIRRLERNQEREQSISNMEYLKNVVYKFLTFTNVEERTQLLPVLSTMLKLSPTEQNAIMNTKVTSQASTGAIEGWTNYLPKWT